MKCSSGFFFYFHWFISLDSRTAQFLRNSFISKFESLFLQREISKLEFGVAQINSTLQIVNETRESDANYLKSATASLATLQEKVEANNILTQALVRIAFGPVIVFCKDLTKTCGRFWRWQGSRSLSAEEHAQFRG